MPLARGRSSTLHRLSLVDAWQLRPVEVAQTSPQFRKGQTGEFLAKRVMPARMIDGDKTIAPVASRQDQARGIERRGEACAARCPVHTIENQITDRLEVSAEPPCFLKLGAGGGARFGIRCAVAADDLQSKLAFERA